jgi:hypothetical protein
MCLAATASSALQGTTLAVSSPAVAADDGADSPTVLGGLLEREFKAACVFSYVGGVKISKKIW